MKALGKPRCKCTGCARIRMATKGGTGMSKGFGKNGEAATVDNT